MKYKVNRLKLNDPSYPAVLRHISDPPKDFFWVGADPADWLKKPRVSIVGSRKVSPYGRGVTAQLASELAGYGVVVISGLALGVDSIAHQATIDAGGQTVAVLPTSVDKIYPASHANLARKILNQNGTICSEYPRGATTFKLNFIARNRIVSGLTDILLITEATVNSGSLHTARFALEQGKTVMAVPGNITSPASEGANNLIKSGAVPVTSVNDILFALNIQPGQQKIPRLFTGRPKEERVLKLIRQGMASQEDLAIATKADGAEISSILTILEINGQIRPAGGGNWLAV